MVDSSSGWQLSREAEKEKWNDYYASLPTIEEDPITKAFGDEFVAAVSGFLPPDSRTLEAGCGAGWQSLALARTGSYDVSLLDFSSEALEHARRIFGQSGVPVSISEGDVFAAAPAEYDLVFNAGVLEHYTFEQQVAFLKGMAGRSRRYVLVLVPNRLCYWYWLWRAQQVGSGQWPYGKEVPLVDMSEAFEAAGMRYIGQRFMGSNWTEGYIDSQPGIDPETRHTILELHRSAVEIPLAQKAYLVAFLATVDGSADVMVPGWERSQIIEPLQAAEMNALLTDAVSLRIGAENEVSRLKAQLLERPAEHEAELKQFARQRDLLIADRDQQLARQNVEIEALRTRASQLLRRVDDNDTRIAQYESDLNLVYSTKAWRWTSAYWRLRQQGLKGYLLLFIRLIGMLLLAPFWLVYQFVRLVYHILIPKPLRLVFWNWRWRMTHRAEVSALASGGRNARHGHSTDATTPQYAKTGKHFFIFAGVPFYDIGGGQRSAQLAKTLNKMGYSVHYIYAVEASDKGERVTDIPVTRHTSLSDFAPKQLISELMGEPVFIFEVPAPQFEPYLQLAPTIGAKVIYEHIDNWETSLGSMFYSEPTFRAFLSHADVIAATARPLQEKVQQFMEATEELAGQTGKVIYLPNAVDTDLFDPAFQRELPADLVVGDVTLLYYGSLWGEWFDWSLILKVATECPHCSINLIGDFKPIEHLTKKAPKNVHFLGAKLQTELPAYLTYTDVTLLPFKNDDIGKYVSPLKIFEYIAMNKRVLATALPDILGYPNVHASDSGDDWVSYVRDMTGAEPNGVTSFAFASANNWYARSNALLDAIEAPAPGAESARDDERPRVTVIALNHNNRKVIGRCIDSIFQYSKRYDIEFIVVDNQSTDGSDVYVEQMYGDRIVFLRNSKNGCSSGRNLGVSHAHGDYLLFVDSDQWAVSERWLDTSLHILDAYRNVGAVSWSGGWFSKGSFGGPITAYMPNGGVLPAQYLRTDVAYLGSGGLLMRRDVWNATEGFDEFYDPTVFEDTDLALQIKDMGFELAYTPYMNLMHLPHQTTKAGSEAHQRLMDRNSAYFGKKWKARNPKLLECYLH